ncbi:uncharacterized protein LOC119079027 [Bradysia coprophila]|uniref:uncharacterized protein LOC119079027 n=1 Tax=Bradysia coprophila TaxID=38358 RepID=UPI00187DD3ED|nr:uncharacterized protein LOC119079027 [Bradysia coprophila]
MIKALILFACVIGICSAAAINNVQPESESNVVENAVEEVNGDQATDLETAELKHFGFGPKVVVINKGYGGYGGYRGGGYSRGCGCGSSHYHSHHRYYGKKK